MATIEGKPAAEWFADAAKRQKKSNAYAKYTPEAKKPEAKTAATPEGWNREGWPKTAAPGQPGYRDPNAKKPMIGSMPKPAESNKPGRSQEHIDYGSATAWEEERQAMKERNNLIGSLRRNKRPIPKESPSANYSGIPDTIQEQAARNNLRGMLKRGEEGDRKMQWIANRRPAPGQAMGSESEWRNKLNAAKKSGQARSYVRKAEEARPKLFSMQAEARDRFKNAR